MCPALPTRDHRAEHAYQWHKSGRTPDGIGPSSSCEYELTQVTPLAASVLAQLDLNAISAMPSRSAWRTSKGINHFAAKGPVSASPEVPRETLVTGCSHQLLTISRRALARGFPVSSSLLEVPLAPTSTQRRRRPPKS